MKIYVREYSWMWSDLHLSLAECRVYAYIYGLTHGDKGGYNGSKRHLAELLGLPKSTAFDALDTLMEKHHIVYANGVWKSVRVPDENVRVPDENVREASSPHTPLYNNINNKNKASMQTNFDLFWKYFSPSAQFNNRREATKELFEARTSAAQKALIEAAQNGEHQSPPNPQPNPYFFVQDFPEPQPKWLRGDEEEDIVQVKYNGAFKLCSRATMELFGLQWVRDW